MKRRVAAALVSGLLLAAASSPRADDEWDDPKSPAECGLRSVTADETATPPSEDAGVALRRLERELAFRPRGTIAREAVAATITDHLREVRYCFARAQARDPGLAGRVLVRFIVDTGGRVAAAAAVSSSLDNQEAEQCVVAAVRRWSFPRAQGAPVVIAHPFTLKGIE